VGEVGKKADKLNTRKGGTSPKNASIAALSLYEKNEQHEKGIAPYGYAKGGRTRAILSEKEKKKA